MSFNDITMELQQLIKTIKEEIIQKTKPIAVFLYGSYNTPEYLPGVSDLEIGVIKTGKKSIFKMLRLIAKKYSTRNIRLRIYSYDLEELRSLSVDSPFTKSVFTRHLILTSKTIWGDKIIEKLPLPPITLLDAYREACFSTMRALSGIFFLRANQLAEALEMAYKACLFATLSLEYLLGEFPVGFKNIVKVSKRLDLDKQWRELVDFAYKLRQNKIRPSKDELYDFTFKVITYSNQIVEERLKKELKKGDRVLVKENL